MGVRRGDSGSDPRGVPAERAMTYLQFLLVFIVPATLLALAALRSGGPIRGRARIGLFVIPLIALIYTTPWDNYLVSRGVWSYPPGRVMGTIGYVPIEEYLFFLLQPILAGAFFLSLVANRPAGNAAAVTRRRAATPRMFRTVRAVGALASVAVLTFGAWLLTTEPGTYLGLIFVWAAPVLVLQWLWGGEHIAARPNAVALGIAVPTAYLCAADWWAIREGIWEIAEPTTLGPSFFGLPMEEAVFFLVTNTMVVLGMQLLLVPSLPWQVRDTGP